MDGEGNWVAGQTAWVGFWVAALATALIFYGANATWVEVAGIEIKGQSPLIRLSADVDPVWIYAGAGMSAFGLLVFALTRMRLAFGFCAIGAIGVGGVLVADIGDLQEVEQIVDLASGAYMTGGGAVLLLIASLIGAR